MNDTPIPPGRYPLKHTGLDRYGMLEFTITEGEYIGRKVWMHMNQMPLFQAEIEIVPDETGETETNNVTRNSMHTVWQTGEVYYSKDAYNKALQDVVQHLDDINCTSPTEDAALDACIEIIETLKKE